MVWSDHVIAGILVIVLPLVGNWKFRRLQRDIAAGNPVARGRMYGKTATMQWSMLTLTVGHWFWRDRSAADLGLLIESGWRFWTGFAVCCVFSTLFVMQAKIIRGNVGAQRHVRKTTRNLAAIAPGDQRELRLFYGLSVTAGVCEEILYRGYMIWYIQQTLPLWLSLIVAAVFFGFGHAYQGMGGIAKTFAVGLVTGGLYVLMRTVWGVVLLHAVVDMTSGFVLHCVNHLDPDRTAEELGASYLVDPSLPSGVTKQ